MPTRHAARKPLSRTAGEGGSPARASRVRVVAPSPQPAPPMGERGPSGRVCVGAVAGAHGVRGAVKIKSFTGTPEDIACYGALEDESGERHFTLRLTGSGKGVLIGHLSGITDRNQAEAARGLRLYLHRNALPPTEADEYYHADLIGLEAVLSDGTAVGPVRAVHDFGAGDTLEIARAEGPPLIVPFTRAVVPSVDLAAGRLVIEPPPGLLDPITSAGRPIEEIG